MGELIEAYEEKFKTIPSEPCVLFLYDDDEILCAVCRLQNAFERELQYASTNACNNCFVRDGVYRQLNDVFQETTRETFRVRPPKCVELIKCKVEYILS